MSRISGRLLLLATIFIVTTATAVAFGLKRDLQTYQQPKAPEGTTPLKVETIADGLQNPWSLVFLPDGSMLVDERPGHIRIIRDGKLVADPVANTPETYANNQAGYFDLALDPDYADNHTLYLAYNAGSKEASTLRVISATFDGAALSNIKTIFEAVPTRRTTANLGGRILFLPDGTMLVSVGDGFDFREQAQKLDNDFGKIVRINKDGSIPQDNPFVGKKGARPEIWTYGNRNPEGLALAADGTIYETEHGPRGGDEINKIEKGANYGWPLATYGIDYSGARITPFTEYPGTVQPLKYWTPSPAPSGLAVYSGDLFPEWKGDLLAGAMAEMSLHHVTMKDGKPTGDERYLVGMRVRDVRQGPDGAIWVTTEDHGGAPTGKVLRLTPQ
ncbi:MAG TPA: PQQ-dependent sugar dehydrogenase [Parvularculaceae bacterium]|nr:PQQ-dependent sugar dehydrogenase [Parvularculaceae bacterium]